MLLLIFLSVIASSSSSTEDPLAGHYCTFITGNDGFKCLNGGGCIPLEWVCNEQEQVCVVTSDIILQRDFRILSEVIYCDVLNIFRDRPRP